MLSSTKIMTLAFFLSNWNLQLTFICLWGWLALVHFGFLHLRSFIRSSSTLILLLLLFVSNVLLILITINSNSYFYRQYIYVPIPNRLFLHILYRVLSDFFIFEENQGISSAFSVLTFNHYVRFWNLVVFEKFL